MPEVITVKVSKEIKASEAMRRALLEEIKQKERGELISALEDANEILSKMDGDVIVKSIREDRDSRRLVRC